MEAFHAVRRMTYASTGSRAPADLVRSGQGACTAKHLLLAELLNSVGVPARVDMVFGAFGAGLPEAPGMPEELRTMVREGGVPDYHNVVTATIDGGEILLDATWHDAMAPLGFPVNDGWDGHGSTRPAVQGRTVEPRGGDIPARKAELIAALPARDQERRQRFIELITRYSVAQ